MTDSLQHYHPSTGRCGPTLYRIIRNTVDIQQASIVMSRERTEPSVSEFYPLILED